MIQCKIEMNRENIMATLGGAKAYSDEDAYLRELLENAVDACNMREALSWSFGTEFLELEEARALNSIREPFHPRILITYSSQTQRLSVEDNGFGMNAIDIENYVAKIGSSYYTSEDFAKQKLDYEPISQFGVGILSCFVVAKALLIESKKDKSVNTAWNISNPQPLEPITAKWIENEEIEYINSSRTEPGTRITLVLRTQYAQKLSLPRLIGAVSRYMLFQPFPIEISFDSHRVILQDQNRIMHNPYADVLGVVSIPVRDDLMEGYIWIYNSRQEAKIGKSALYQQGFLVAEGTHLLDLKPEWLQHMSFRINMRKRFLNLRLSRDGVVDDEKKKELREKLGRQIQLYFSENLQSLERYLSSGQEPVVNEYEAEMKLLEQAVTVEVFLKGKEIELPIQTIIRGFEGKTARFVFMSKGMFTYYRLNYFLDYKKIEKENQLIVFEKNRDIFCQMLTPYRREHRYVISENPGIVYDEMLVDFQTIKSVAGYRNSCCSSPDLVGYDEIFCLVANEQNGRLEVLMNDMHPLAKMLAPVWHQPKVHNMMAVILENIKQRIIDSKTHWNKIVDFGGSYVDEWDPKNVATVQSVHCLESDFIESLNEYIECKLSPEERMEMGLVGFQFHRVDFISWWFMPKE